MLPANLDKKHAFIYVEDIARSMVALALSEEVWGDVWILPHSPGLSLRNFLIKSYEAAGQTPQKLGTRPRIGLKLLGALGKIFPISFLKMVKEVNEVNYQFFLDWEVDDSKFVNKFGIKATPVEEGLKHTMDWYLKHLS